LTSDVGDVGAPHVIVTALEGLKMRYPSLGFDPKSIIIP